MKKFVFESLAAMLVVYPAVIALRTPTRQLVAPKASAKAAVASATLDSTLARAPLDPNCLVSAKGIDYEPLMEQLRIGDYMAADQTTRDVLIEMAGEEAMKRGYVYWTEARQLPNEDLATVENLWLHYSDGKFGYTVQKNVWRLQKGVFDKFCDKIGWTTTDEITGQPRKRRWFGDSEFFYSLDKAPKAHLPLTSALRGTQLLKALLQHQVWETEEWKRDLPELSA
jgi:hypothetical protein|tara:strand:+ start:265 stop:942 length:678 start_codon:yes stop_codon:yes gene_type:complete